MKIADEYLTALRLRGYTESEARFLYIAATYSGYFVARQFLACSGAKWGYRTNHFTTKLRKAGHAVSRTYPGIGRVYHVSRKSLYSAIDRSHLRSRLPHSSALVRLRLVLLDFMVENQQYDYFETQEQKLAYFRDDLHLSESILPSAADPGDSSGIQTHRCFEDRYPLFLDRSVPGSPVLAFSYVDPGDPSTEGFERHLRAYGRLLSHLNRFRFLFISNSPMHFASAEKCFFSLMKRPGSDSEADEVLRYFHHRRDWENKEYRLLLDSDIIFLNEATARFVGARVDSLYAKWVSNQLAEDEIRQELSSGKPVRPAEFATYLVRESAHLTGPGASHSVKLPSNTHTSSQAVTSGVSSVDARSASHANTQTSNDQ